MKRKQLARLGLILAVIGVAPVVSGILLTSLFGPSTIRFLPFLAPLGLVGTAGILLLFFAWARPPEKDCPECGAANPATAPFCARCGKPARSA